MEKLIITAALTGSITVPTQTKYRPYTPEAIVADAIACAKAGASAVHIHVRDPQDGHPTSDPELFGEVVGRIKAESNVIVGLTTGGAMGMTPPERLRVVPLFQPELASFNLGSINFSMHPVARHFKPEDYRFEWEQAYVEGTKDFILRNTFGDMEAFAQTMQANNTRPEFEAYDVGHLYNLRFLQRSGLVKTPHRIQFGALTRPERCRKRDRKSTRLNSS